MEELRKVLKDCYEESCLSYKNGDKYGITKYYAEDAVMLWPGFKMCRGQKALDEILSKLMSFPTPTNFKFETDELVLMSEDTAYERGSFTVTTDDGKPFQSGKTIVIWKKIDGKWLIDVDSFNNNLMPEHYLNKA